MMSKKFLLPSGLLIKDPLKRLCRDATKAESQVKSHAFFKSIDWNALEAKQIPPPFRPRVVSEFVFLEGREALTLRYHGWQFDSWSW